MYIPKLQASIFDHSKDVNVHTTLVSIRICTDSIFIPTHKKKFVLEELPKSSNIEDMRKIRQTFLNSTVNILTEMCSQTIDSTELYSKISRIR